MKQSGNTLEGATDHTLRERAVQRQHFVEGAVDDPSMGGSFGEPPDHDPMSDKILPAVVNVDGATVETQNTTHESYFEFELINFAGDWRIRKVTQFFDPPEEMIFSETRRTELLASPSHSSPLPVLPTGVTPNCHRLFEDGRRVIVDGNEMTIKVQETGDISLPSGIIGVNDFGSRGDDFLPLSRSVPGGTYRVQQAMAGRTVIAVQIIFQREKTAAEYRPAPIVEGSGPDLHHVGVDAGNVAVFDAAKFILLEARELERLYIKSLDSNEETSPRNASFDLPVPLRIRISPTETPNGYKFQSGYGDGSYPAYWGLDRTGSVVNLTIDFLITAEFLTEVVRVPWSSKMIGQTIVDPILKKWEQEVELGHEGNNGFIKVTGSDRIERARLLGEGGRILADSQAGGSSHADDESIYYFGTDLRRVEKAVLELIVSAGYKN